MRMVGPNCLGVLTTDPAVRMDASFAPTWPPRGRVSFSSQSGALGLAILDYAKALGIGVRSFVSVGNKADISGNDLIEWWETDPETDVILLYLESFGNPRNFINLARRVAKEKPIVAVKSGRTAAGSRAATSHTGALAGEDSAVDALFAQTGVIRTDTIEELFDMSMLLANQPVPASNRLAIVTNAGGPGIMATDACESRGLVVTPLSEATMENLRGFLPSEASVKNPVDMIASASAESYGKAVRVLLEDPQVDSLLVIFVPPIITEAPAVAAAVREALATTPAAKEKTILACFLGTRGVPESLVTLQAGKVPSYAFPEAAAIALSRAVDYGKWKRLPEPVFLMYGLGGVAVEILKDVAWGIAPIADLDADRMIGSVKGSKMLAGVRGAPPADVPTLKDVMLRVSQLVCDFPEIQEMDLNPVHVLPVGKGAIAVDARIKLAEPKKPQSMPGAAAAVLDRRP